MRVYGCNRLCVALVAVLGTIRLIPCFSQVVRVEVVRVVVRLRIRRVWIVVEIVPVLIAESEVVIRGVFTVIVHFLSFRLCQLVGCAV